MPPAAPHRLPHSLDSIDVGRIWHRYRITHFCFVLFLSAFDLATALHSSLSPLDLAFFHLTALCCCSPLCPLHAQCRIPQSPLVKFHLVSDTALFTTSLCGLSLARLHPLFLIS